MYYFENLKKIFLPILCVSIFVGTPLLTHAFGVSPKKIEISGDPGEVILGGVSLFSENNSSNDEYFVSFENFRPQGNSGIPEFTGDISGLATWFSSESQVSFNSSGEVFFPFSISIPQDARPGGYFSAIFFEPVTESESLVNEKIGVLVFLRVNGEILEEGSILSFSLKNNKKIATQEPLFFEYRFKNDGQDRIVPKGTIQVFNMFNSQIAEFSIDDSSSNILPGSFRKFETVFADGRQSFVENETFFNIVKNQYKNFKFGIYKADLMIEWGEDGAVENKQFNFFFLPWHLLVVVFGILGVLFFVGRYLLGLYTKHILTETSTKKTKDKI